jgi:mono/diheme cytochrome c family protein
MFRVRLSAALAAAVLIAGCQRSDPKPDQSTAASLPADTTTPAQGMGAGGVENTTKPQTDTASAPPAISHDSFTPKRDSGPSSPAKKRDISQKITPDSSGRDTGKTSASKPQPPAAPAGPASSAGPDQPLHDAYHSAPLDTVDNKVYQGWKYFNLNCSRCHGEDVQGTTIAPHLIVSLKPNGTIPDEATFQTTVCGGRVAKGMPAWCSLGMTPGQIDTIYSYVKGRSDAKLHPGRPARKTE